VTYSIAIEQARQPDVEQLLAASSAYALALYPPENTFLLDVEALERPGVLLYLARDGTGVALGMAAIVDAVPGMQGDAELKRMVVHEFARGQGVALALLARIETEARARGVARIVLETGTFHTAAQSLYTRAGYQPIPQFGPYRGEPYSLCYAKPL
jgi:putative acetyltransferase